MVRASARMSAASSALTPRCERFAGGVSAKDARALASMLYCQPELIETQPKGSFAAHVRGQTKGAVPLQFPFGYMEAMPRMDKAERSILRQTMRDRYAVHYSELGKAQPRSDDVLSERSDQPAQNEAEPARMPKVHKPQTGKGSQKSGSGQINTDASESW